MDKNSKVALTYYNALLLAISSPTPIPLSEDKSKKKEKRKKRKKKKKNTAIQYAACSHAHMVIQLTPAGPTSPFECQAEVQLQVQRSFPSPYLS